MAKDFVQVAPDGAGARVDTRSFNRSAVGEVEQQVVGIGNGTDAEVVQVATAAPAGADPGLVVRNIPSGTQDVADASVVAQIESLQDQLPSALAGGRLDVAVGASVLPTGAATEVTLASVLADLVLLLAKLPAALAAGGGLKVEGVVGGVAVPTSLSALPLPAGAATEASLAAAAASLAAIDGGIPAALAAGGGMKIEGVAGGVVVPVSDGGASLTVDSPQLPGALAAGGGIKVEGVAGGVAQPISGTVTVSSSPAAARTTDSIAAAMQTDALMNGLTALTPLFAAVNIAADGALIAANATKKLRVVAAFLNSDVDGKLAIKNGSGGSSLIPILTLRGGGGFVLPFNPLGWCETSTNTALYADITTLTQLSGCLVYVEV